MGADIRFFDEDENGESTRAADMLFTSPNWRGTALIETREPSEFIWVWDNALEDYVLVPKGDLDAS